MKDYWQNYIDGKFVDGGAGVIQVDNPGTGEKLDFLRFLVKPAFCMSCFCFFVRLVVRLFFGCVEH